MLDKDKYIGNRVFITLLLVIYAIYIYILNGWLPYISDDYSYSLVYKDVEINSLCDLLYPQYLHYLYSNGRVVIHALLEGLLILSPDKVLFDVCNTIVWLLLVWGVVKISVPQRSSDFIYWLVAVMGIRFLLPESSYLYYWAAGSFNYYWSAVMVGGFLLLYDKAKRGRRIPVVILPFVILFSLLAGWTHESLVVGVAIALLVDVMCDRRGRARVPISMAIGFICGFVLLFVAPSNYIRVDAKSTDVVTHILKSGYILTELRLSWLLVIALLYGVIRNREKVYVTICNRRILFVAWVVNGAFCLFIGFTERAFFFTELIAFVLLMSYLPFLLEKVKPKVYNTITIIILVLLLGYESVVGCEMYKLGNQVDRCLQTYRSSTKDYVVSPEWEPLGLVHHQVPSIMEFWGRYNPYREIDTAHRMFRIVPQATYRAIVSGELFDEANRLKGELPFYTTDSISSVVMPCDGFFADGEFDEFMNELLSGHRIGSDINGAFIYHFYPASVSDPNLSLLGWLRRVLYPASLPRTGGVDSYYNINPVFPHVIAGREYVILRKPEFRWVESVEYRRAE